MSVSPSFNLNALRHGTELHWYTIDRVLGQGAFGITYLATDNNLHRPVAIKEYLPGQLVHREQDGSVLALTDELVEEYEAGLKRFIFEARTLARFEHPAIVRVHNIFEANRTAYMVMQYEQGEGLDRLLKARGTLTEHEILQLLHPLLDGLEVIHGAGFVHRDIKPANIFVRSDGTPVLLDFGSAREAMTGESRTITNFVSPGYAPIEQYAGKSDQQGPWSDIYALGATMYRAMTARAPNDAVERSQALAQNTIDSYQVGARHAKRSYSAQLLGAVDHALAFRVQDRPQNIAAWRQELPPRVEADINTADWDSATAPTIAIDNGAPTLAVTIATGLATAPRVDTHPASAPAEAPAQLGTLTRARLARIEKRHYAYGLAVLVISALAVGSWLGRGVIEPQPHTIELPAPAAESAAVAAAPAGATPVEAAPAAAPEVIPPAPSAAPAGTGVTSSSEQVALLLFAASSDIEAARLMSPAGQNAYEKYRAVLNIEPANAAAREGLNTLAERYLALAYREMDAGRFELASSYIANAATAAPKLAALADARRTLATRRPVADNSAVPVIAPRKGAPIVEMSSNARGAPR
ncbi:MAG: serine/threonine protein kinase [Proteobacteria bacterium]|nr:serine/threonine protein kinase [Pseudomonadota bacterium]